MNITPTVRDILERSTITDNCLVLPPGLHARIVLEPSAGKQFMTLKHALITLEAKSVVVTEPTTTVADYNRRFTATVNGHVLIIWTQGQDVATMRVRSVIDHDEPQSDYGAGSFYDTMPQVLRAMGIGEARVQ